MKIVFSLTLVACLYSAGCTQREYEDTEVKTPDDIKGFTVFDYKF